jgi:hypothetical protein
MSTVSWVRGASGKGLAAAVKALHRAEDQLARGLIDLSDRHATDHEIHFVARDLAEWSREHVRRLAEHGRSRGVDLDLEPGSGIAWAGAVRRAGAELLGRRHAPIGMLLADLRDLHQQAAAVSLDWEILAQGAQATEDAELLELAASCHPQTLRQLRWTNAHVKELAAQALTAT